MRNVLDDAADPDMRLVLLDEALTEAGALACSASLLGLLSACWL